MKRKQVRNIKENLKTVNNQFRRPNIQLIRNSKTEKKK